MRATLNKVDDKHHEVKLASHSSLETPMVNKAVGYKRTLVKTFAIFSGFFLLFFLCLIKQSLNASLSKLAALETGLSTRTAPVSTGEGQSVLSALSELLRPLSTQKNSLERRNGDYAVRKHPKSVKFGDYQKDDGDEADNATNGAISATYFVNWAIYGRNHFPWDLPFKSLTHVFYAFANVRPETGEIYLSDSWADEQIHWAERGDSWNDEGNNLYGCFNQFRKLKQEHRHLKLLISIGGWTYSSNFGPGTSTPEKRNTFAKSAISILEDYGLDGIDIDWEYPENDAEAGQMVDLLRKIRKGLDVLKKKKKDQKPYLLTIAAPCGPSHYKQLRLKDMHQYLSFINLMAYDYAGSWDTVSGHQANLKRPENEVVNQGNFSTVAAINYYTENSVPRKKLVMGMPLYGRSFLNTKGIGRPYNGVGQGTWEQGVYDYKALPQAGTKYVEDWEAIGAYTYNEENQELISFDSPSVVSRKVHYLNSKDMGGVMWWESSADKNKSGHALIPLAASKLGTLDSTANHLYYPDSKWDNLKNYKPTSQKHKAKKQHPSHCS